MKKLIIKTKDHRTITMIYAAEKVEAHIAYLKQGGELFTNLGTLTMNDIRSIDVEEI